MLPISLSLSNFLSYRDAAPTLHLEGIRVACLCGPNGNGKSALLDAVTWALWGKARGQRHEQLLHHGQTEMQVELVFDVGSERYRVSRRYSQARRNPQSSLELAVQTASGEFTTAGTEGTGDTIRETQARIERLINMDYGTFVNSAFLVQGRADQFTMATPGERKDVLSRVLGLGRYDELAERARLRGRDARAKLDATAINIDRLRERAAKAGETRAALAEAERELAEAVAYVNGLAERLQLLRDKVAHLERRQAERDEQDAAAQRARQRQAARKQRPRTSTSVSSVGSAPSSAPARSSRGSPRCRGHANTHGRWLRRRSRRTHSGRNSRPLENAIGQARARLESDIQSQRQHVDTQLTPRAESLPSIQRGQDALAERQAAMESRRNDAAQAEESRRQLELGGGDPPSRQRAD